VLPEERCGNGSLCAGRQEPLSYVGQALLGIEDGWASSDHFDGPELLAVSAHYVDGVRPAAAAALDNADPQRLGHHARRHRGDRPSEGERRTYRTVNTFRNGPYRYEIALQHSALALHQVP
jgi:hypothetical protein